MIKKLLNDNLLVEVINQEQKTESGLYIPESANEKNIQTGIVAFVGIGRKNEKGEVISMEVKVGDKILFEKSYNAQEIKIDNQEYQKISANDVIAIIE